MSLGTRPAQQVVDGDGTATVEVDVRGRWHALALYELLSSFHSFLVQHAADRWVVHASAPGCNGEPLAVALRAIDEWRAERGLDTTVRVDWQPRGTGRRGGRARKAVA